STRRVRACPLTSRSSGAVICSLASPLSVSHRRTIRIASGESSHSGKATRTVITQNLHRGAAYSYADGIVLVEFDGGDLDARAPNRGDGFRRVRGHDHMSWLEQYRAAG